MNSKGSISISINMIVVVVLAFVMLGLMLTLGQSIIDNAQRTSSQVSEQVRADIINRLTQSNDPLYFTQRQFDVPFGKDETIAFGVKNTAPGQRHIALEIHAIKDDGVASGKLSPSTNRNAGNTENDGGAFFWIAASQSFNAGEGRVFDVQYRAPTGNDATGAYMFNFRLYSGSTAAEALNPANRKLEAEQIIFINVI